MRRGGTLLISDMVVLVTQFTQIGKVKKMSKIKTPNFLPALGLRSSSPYYFTFSDKNNCLFTSFTLIALCVVQSREHSGVILIVLTGFIE